MPLCTTDEIPTQIRNPIGITSVPINASFTSRAPIVLPRNSGVLPTINPPTKTVITANIRIP